MNNHASEFKPDVLCLKLILSHIQLILRELDKSVEFPILIKKSDGERGSKIKK